MNFQCILSIIIILIMHNLHFHSDCVLCVVVSIICSYSLASNIPSLASNIPNICLLYCVIILYSDEQSEGEYKHS